MTDEPENHTLRLLREIRDTQAGFHSELTAFRAEAGKRFDELEVAVATVSADLRIVKARAETIDERLITVETRMNAVERRLGRIETHTGLVKA